MSNAETRRLAREKMRAYRSTPAGKESTRRQNEKRREAIRAWHLAHPDRVREIKRKNNATKSPDVIAFHNHRSRSTRLGLPKLGVSPADWAETIEVFAGRCAYCLGPADGRDHIEPLSRGGLDVTENVVPCCISCNSSKHNKTLLGWLASGGGL